MNHETKCLSQGVSRISCLTTKDPTEQRISRFSVTETACWDDVYANKSRADNLTNCHLCECVFQVKAGFHSTVRK